MIANTNKPTKFYQRGHSDCDNIQTHCGYVEPRADAGLGYGLSRVNRACDAFMAERGMVWASYAFGQGDYVKKVIATAVAILCFSMMAQAQQVHVNNAADLEVVFTTETSVYLKVMAGPDGAPQGFDIAYESVLGPYKTTFQCSKHRLRPFEAVIVQIPAEQDDPACISGDKPVITCGTILNVRALITGGRPSNRLTTVTQDCQ